MEGIRILQLVQDHKALAKGLKRRRGAPTHVDRTIDWDTVVIAPDGTIIAVFIKQVIPSKLHRRAYKSWKTVNELPDKRAAAVGVPSLPRIKKNGTLDTRSGVPKEVLKVLKKQGVRQGTLGYLDATSDKPCHETRLTKEHPGMLGRNRTLIELVDKLYKRYLPTIHAIQQAEVERAPRFKLWHSAFSSIYIAKKFPTAYHTDTGNLLGVMTALITMGNFRGGELAMPRWKIAFALKPGDLLLFNPQELHGNLPIRGKRVSAAFFCARRIADCRH